MKLRSLAVVSVALLAVSAAAENPPEISVVQSVPAVAPNRHYPSNRAPLAVSPLVKLPIGSVTPRGWVRDMLRLEADGMVGHLEEISAWCRFDPGNGWVNPQSKEKRGWEELPYWLKGYGDLGYVLKDQKITANARKWIDAILKTQREDGYFGPRHSLTSLKGQPDLWPNMLVLNVLQSLHEYSGDERVIPFMTKYFRWEMSIPEQDFLVGYWPKVRGGDNLESVYWLYNRTGEPWLLDLAKKIHAHTADWTSGVINWHGVNLTQSFREPAEFWMQAKDERFLRAMENDYDTVMGTYGQFPGGGFAADENARPGYTDPRQGFETCSVVEFMHSFEMLTRITGSPLWSDRCEDVAFNTFPAACTPDLKALHYLTSANQAQLDRGNKSPGIQNKGTMFSYSPQAVYRCCQHNVSHGWPYYAEELWLATADNGLCASLYAESEVTAKVGDGNEVKITETTEYPFAGAITFKISAAQPTRFPLYLRVPRWCRSPQVKVNGAVSLLQTEGPFYIAINRQWSDGDTVTLTLPMEITVRTWEKNHNAVSIDRGPFTYSLKIEQRWSRYGGSDAFPEYEVFPTTPWNYGLVIDPKNPAASLEFTPKEGPPSFDPAKMPLAIKAKAKRIPNWRLDARGLIAPLQASPVRSSEPVETITLVPMGAAPLRITAFPLIGEGEGAHEWAEQIK